MKTKKLKKFLLILFLFIGFLEVIAAQSEGIFIEGKVKDVPDQEIFLELLGINGENKIIQTTKIVNGEFIFKVTLSNPPALLDIKFEDPKYKLKGRIAVLSAGIILADNNQNIKADIFVDTDQAKHTSGYIRPVLNIINESPSYKRLLEFTEEMQKNFDLPRDQIAKKLKDLNIDWSKQKPDSLSKEKQAKLAEYREEAIKLAEGKMAFLKTYIEQNSNDITSLFCLFELYKSPFSFTYSEESWTDLYNSLSPEIRESHIGHFFKNILAQKKQNQIMAESVSIGKLFKDFTLQDINEKDIQLSSILKKNKYVLLDFWASWCKPCRAENPKVLKAYNEYHDKGFDVVAVSLDESKTAWLKAIKDDGMPWTQLSDLKGSKSEIVKMYGVTRIPTSFLLDQNGSIVATELRGEKLTDVLEKLLGD